MKMLFDAHLPRRLARLVADQGVDVRHTLSLPDGNIHNQALATLLLDYLPNIEQAFLDNTFVERSQQGLVVHG